MKRTPFPWTHCWEGFEMTVEEALELAPSVRSVPEWVIERAAENLPRYLWITTEGRERWLRCEACGTQWEEHRGRKWPDDLRQGQRTSCPRCGEAVIPKQMGRGFRNIKDRLKLIWYERSPERPDAIAAHGAWCERDFDFADGERPWTLAPEVEVRSFAVFIHGEDGYRFRHYHTVWEDSNGILHDGWRFKPVNRLGCLTFGDQYLFMGRYSDPVPAVLLEDTLADALRDTPFLRAWDGAYMLNEHGRDGVEALTLIARYPCVEYLTKLGMTEFMTARLLNGLPGGEMNWRGRSMAQVFRLDRGRLGELKHAGIMLTPPLLILLHWLERQGIRLTAPEAANVAELLARYTTGERQNIGLENGLKHLEKSRWKKALRYMARTAAKLRDMRLHCGDFFDYWIQMARLHEDLNRDAVAFPSDLRAAEARATERLRRLKDEQNAAARAIKDEKIAKLLPGLTKRYGFSFGGLTLRPARDSAEVIREGRALHHCVAGYVDNYAAGHTVICVLRRDCDPDMPWRTVEISTGGRLIQDRGFHNDRAGFGLPLTESYRAALDCFWSAWRERAR